MKIKELNDDLYISLVYFEWIPATAAVTSQNSSSQTAELNVKCHTI